MKRLLLIAFLQGALMLMIQGFMSSRIEKLNEVCRDVVTGEVVKQVFNEVETDFKGVIGD